MYWFYNYNVFHFFFLINAGLDKRTDIQSDFSPTPNYSHFLWLTINRKNVINTLNIQNNMEIIKGIYKYFKIHKYLCNDGEKF